MPKTKREPKIRRIGTPAAVKLNRRQALELRSMNALLEEKRRAAVDANATLIAVRDAMKAKLREFGLDPSRNPVWDANGEVRYVREKDLPRAIAEISAAS